MANTTNYTVYWNNASDVQNLFNQHPSTAYLTGDLNLNLTVWTDTLWTLNFDPLETNFTVISQTVSDLFKPERFSYSVICTYPISGQYGFLARLSYYLLLIFALILRKHLWLSTAALGTAMTYAATTCVHAFSLLVRYRYHDHSPRNSSTGELEKKGVKYFGDLDMVPMLQILASAAIMLTPILNWSNVVKEHKARSIVVWWGLLVFTALVPVTVVNWRGVFPFVVEGQFATCKTVVPGCTYDQASTARNWLSKDFYDKCDCKDDCGAVSVPGAPFRRDSNVQAFLVSDKVENLLESATLYWFYTTNIILLAFIGAQGVLGLVEIKYSQRRVRSWMFRHIAGLSPRSRRPAKARLLTAKWVAAGFYVFAVLIAAMCPLIFVSNIIVNEIISWGYPYGETYDAIGQWGIWVSALFVILAALMEKYSHAWMQSIVLGGKTLMRPMNYVCGKNYLRTTPTGEERNKENSIIERTKVFFRQLELPFVHIANSIGIPLERMRGEWAHFIRWWKDPVQVFAEDDSLLLHESYTEIPTTAHHVTEALEWQSGVNGPNESAKGSNQKEKPTSYMDKAVQTLSINHTIQENNDESWVRDETPTSPLLASFA